MEIKTTGGIIDRRSRGWVGEKRIACRSTPSTLNIGGGNGI